LLLYFRPGQRLLTQKARVSLVYFVVAGQVQVYQDDKFIRTLGPGEVLGEQSALYTNICTATVTALSDVQCLAMDKSHLQIIFSLSLSHFIYKNSIRIAFDHSASLGPLTTAQKEALLSQVKVHTYAYDEVVISEGTPFNEGLWVVLQGNLIAKDRLREEESYIVAEFSCVNDDIVLEADDQGSFTLDVAANCEEVAVGFLPLSSLRTTLGSAFRLPVCTGTEEILTDLPFLQGFSAKQIEMLCRLAEPRAFLQNEALPEATHTSNLCLLRKGSVLLSNLPQPDKELVAPSHFGCGSSNHTSALSSVTVLQPAQCLLLSRTHFRAIFGEQSQASVQRLLELQIGAGLLLSELTIVRRYEKLRTGSMFLVTDSEGREYGLKRICRKKIKSLFMSAKLRNEREIMQKLSHPLVTRLIRTFRDTHYVYFLREFVHGMMLSDLLPRVGCLEEQEARVYVAMVIWILEHLHGLGVMHRDVNPESFLVDAKGYFKLVDLGSACVADRADSVAGSPHFIAPEVLKGEGYSNSADLWSLGILSFEFLHGRVPYGDSEEDPYLVFEAVLKGLLPPLDSALSPDCQSFLLSLLNQDPLQRGSIGKVKQHPWLQDFPWNELTSQRLKPAFKDMANARDVMTSPSRFRKHYPFQSGEMSPARPIKRRVTMSGDWSSDF
jgi:cGMP-dependent protein kinase